MNVNYPKDKDASFLCNPHTTQPPAFLSATETIETLPIVAEPGGRIERTKQVVERVWHAIEAGHFYPSPSPMECPGCPYRQACQQWCV